ncbi:MAG: hypothetical protein JSV79_04875 [Armatimonadota bacterium]|nr:MAG: hypothetical protein JSV79_04875 [Armatimonadota bacterium]
MADRSDRVLFLVVVAAVTAAVILAVGRARIEQGNRTVDIIVDGDDARQVALAAGAPLPEVLARLRDAGAGALAVREVTIGELARAGRVDAISGLGQTGLLAPDTSLGPVLGAAVKARLPHAEVRTAAIGIAVGAPMEQLEGVPVLLRPEDLRAARDAKLRVVARLLNFPAVSAEAIAAAAAEAQAAGARLVVFGEEEVLGYDGLLRETAEAFRRHALLYGFVEMAGQQGDTSLARRLSDRLVRVHSISDSDMLTISPEVAAARYARAARERNIRACYVRLMVRGSRDPAATNASYVRGIANALRRDGFEIGPPAPLSAPTDWPPRLLRIVVALGLPAGLVLLVRRFVPVSAGWAWLMLAIVIAGGAGLRAAAPGVMVAVGGLAAAVVFPSLGLVWVLQAARGSGARSSLSRVIGGGLWGLISASAASAAGAMMIVGLYSRVPYLSGIYLFTGVKAAYLAPLALIAAAIIADVPGRVEPLLLWWTRLRLRLGDFFSRPVLVIEALAVVAALVAIAFALSRTGNQPVVAPSGTEIKLRGALESLLAVRPRTKELLLGHPALMAAVALALRNRRTWLPLAAVLAGVGQVSLVNTYCHLHTPLAISLVRTGLGLWIGALVGVVVVVVWRLIFDPPPREAGP